MRDDLYFDDDEWEYRMERFALHPATEENPRDLPCPTCGWPNRLTRADRVRGYQCDACATATERGLDITYYDGEE
jgi:hypothetical protein